MLKLLSGSGSVLALLVILVPRTSSVFVSPGLLSLPVAATPDVSWACLFQRFLYACVGDCVPSSMGQGPASHRLIGACTYACVRAWLSCVCTSWAFDPVLDFIQFKNENLNTTLQESTGPIDGHKVHLARIGIPACVYTCASK
jgi:hypothetical protein